MLKTLAKELIEKLFVEDKLIIEERSILDILFTLREDLIYYINNKERLKLYILSILKQKIFEQVYNLSNYEDYYRYHDRLFYIIFIRHLIKRLREYIAYYSIYQLNQTKRYKLYNSLILIIASIISFHTLAINFIVALLSTIVKNNYLLIITYKIIKRIILISEKKLETAIE